MAATSARYGAASVGETGDGSSPRPTTDTLTVESSTTWRTRSATLATVSPGRMRRFTSARAAGASTFSLMPAWSTVGAIVVRTAAAVEGAEVRARSTTGRNNQRLANSTR